MATAIRRTDSTLESQLLNEAYEFDFHQAVKILEGLRPGCVPFGTGDDPLKEALIIRSRVTLSASGSDVYSLKFAHNTQKPPVLTVSFMGIAGIQGPLPTPYTELVIAQMKNGDTAFRDFLDIFNHRLISFWHRVRMKVVLGLAQISPLETPAGKVFIDLIGLENKFLKNKLAVSDHRLMHYAPLFWHRPKSAVILRQLLKSYLQIKSIEIHQLQGAWHQAPQTERTAIGMTGKFNSLGRNTILGGALWCQSEGFCIRLFGLSWSQFTNLLPLSSQYYQLQDLVYFYCGIEFQPHVELTLNRHEIPPPSLGKNTRIGQTAWLGRGGGSGLHQDPSIRFPIHLRSRQIYYNVKKK